MPGPSPSTIELILLGLLTERPMGAYEFANTISEKKVGSFLKISSPAVYKCLKRLYAGGFLEATVVREGELPSKTVYAVNEQGMQRFHELMAHYATSMNPYYLDCNAFVWNLERVGYDEGIGMLRRLRDELASVHAWILEHEREQQERLPFASKLIVRQYRMTLTALLAWSEEAVTEYERHHREGTR